METTPGKPDEQLSGFAMTEEQNKLAEEIERILAEYHRAVELDDASLLPKRSI